MKDEVNNQGTRPGPAGSPVSKPKENPEIFPLTGLRAIAALWVVLFHLDAKLSGIFEQAPVVRYLFPYIGYLGVDLFFVLSGFVIYYNYAEWFRSFRWSSYGKFLWMRLARLYPVHVFTLGLFVASVLWMNHKGQPELHPELHSKAGFVANLLMVHSWWLPAHSTWNVPAWSISCEWLAYLCFPALIISQLVCRSVRSALMVACVGLLAMAGTLQWLHNDINSQYGLVRIAAEFPAGCCLCYLYRKRAGIHLNWNLILIGLVVVILAGGTVLHPLGLVNYWCVPFMALVILGLAYNRGPICRFLSTRPLLYGGYISYSMYMTHLFTLTFLDKLFPAYEHKSLSVLTDVACVTLVAALTYHVVEEPCRKKMRQAKFLKRTR